jgi:hypothetical protein
MARNDFSHSLAGWKEIVIMLRNTKTISILSVAAVILMATTSLGGLFINGLYARETPSWLAQGLASDYFDLVVMAPLILLTTFLMIRGSRAALFIWLASMIYAVYMFAIYCFAVHFNALFVVYCGTLGCAVYAIIVFFASVDFTVVGQWLFNRKGSLISSWYLIILACLFYGMWLIDIIPAAMHGEIPDNVKEIGAMTNPVHVLDLSMVLPGMALSAILFLRRNVFGYILAPAMLIFTVLMDLTIGWIVVYSSYRGVGGNSPPVMVFAVLAVISAFLFIGTVKESSSTVS